MPRKIVLYFIGFVFFFGYNLAFAGLVINEIMYDLPGGDSASGKSREWIEIYNGDGSEVAVDASKWRIYDGVGNRTINNQVDFSIPAGAYIILAGDKDTFLLDHPSFLGVVYDTGISSLNNTGATLKILDQDGNAVDSVIYTSSLGAAGDGNSLQKIGGAFRGAAPTPGVANETITSPPPIIPPLTPGANGATMSTTSVAGGNIPNPVTVEPKIEAEITAKTLNFVGMPVSFEANAFGYNKEWLHYGKFFWNFGDGGSREIEVSSREKIIHTYFYPGEYEVTLEYNMSNYSLVPEATDKIILKVIAADVVISSLGDEKDFFIELTNNSNYDTDISRWVLSSGDKRFIFPKNTTLGSKKKIIFSSRITSFSINEKNNLKLLNGQEELIFDYGASLLPVVPPKTNTASGLSVNQNQKESTRVVKILEAESKDGNEAVLALGGSVSDRGLEASVLESDIGSGADATKSKIIPLISFVFIGVGASAVYFIRQKRIFSGVGNDFKILDE